MRQTVLDQFVMFTEDFESNVDWLYLDVDGYVTIGLGLFVEPVSQLTAMGIEFVWPATGAPVARADVEKAWAKVKGMQYLREDGGGAFAPATSIRATKASLARAAERRLLGQEVTIRKLFPGWDDFPAPGQLLIVSMSWAMGPQKLRLFPNFCSAVNLGHWAAVAVPHGEPASCQMSEVGQNESFRRRNVANLELARRAVTALAGGGVDELDVPSVLAFAREERARARGLS